jgi:hypothetical protein
MKPITTTILIVTILLGLSVFVFVPYLRDGEEIVGYTVHGVPIKRKEIK